MTKTALKLKSKTEWSNRFRAHPINFQFVCVVNWNVEIFSSTLFLNTKLTSKVPLILIVDCGGRAWKPRTNNNEKRELKLKKSWNIGKRKLKNLKMWKLKSKFRRSWSSKSELKQTSRGWSQNESQSGTRSRKLRSGSSKPKNREAEAEEVQESWETESEAEAQSKILKKRKLKVRTEVKISWGRSGSSKKTHSKPDTKETTKPCSGVFSTCIFFKEFSIFASLKEQKVT